MILFPTYPVHMDKVVTMFEVHTPLRSKALFSQLIICIFQFIFSIGTVFFSKKISRNSISNLFFSMDSAQQSSFILVHSEAVTRKHSAS